MPSPRPSPPRGEGEKSVLCARDGSGARDQRELALVIDALDPGEHRVRTAMGSVKLILAPAVVVQLEAHTTLGTPGSVTSTPPTPRRGSPRSWDPSGSRPAARWPSTSPRRNHQAERRKVLELVEAGKLSAPDAERLIRAMGR